MSTAVQVLLTKHATTVNKMCLHHLGAPNALQMKAQITSTSMRNPEVMAIDSTHALIQSNELHVRVEIQKIYTFTSKKCILINLFCTSWFSFILKQIHLEAKLYKCIIRSFSLWIHSSRFNAWINLTQKITVVTFNWTIKMNSMHLDRLPDRPLTVLI